MQTTMVQQASVNDQINTRENESLLMLAHRFLLNTSAVGTTAEARLAKSLTGHVFSICQVSDLISFDCRADCGSKMKLLVAFRKSTRSDYLQPT